MKRIALVGLVLVAGCFKAVGPGASSSAGSSSSAQGTTAGAISGSAAGTPSSANSAATVEGASGTPASAGGPSTGGVASGFGGTSFGGGSGDLTLGTTFGGPSAGGISAAGTSGGLTNGGSGGGSGTTGSSCSATDPCPGGGTCQLQLSSCEGFNQFVSDGGTCQPPVTCHGSTGSCEGQACANDDGCPTTMACLQGQCMGMSCPDVAPECGAGCTLYSRPHTCDLDCVCPSCEGPDAGSCGACAPPFSCCGDTCVYLQGDTQHCGRCDDPCGPAEMCSGGQCQAALCEVNIACQPLDGGAQFCCGDQCCPESSICCSSQGGGVSTGPRCYPASEGCPLPCLMCL